MRRRIVEVSTELFAENGYHGTSVRDIARAVSFSVSAVYNHFPSKEAILAEVLRRPIVELTERVVHELEATAGRSPLERLAACLCLHVRYVLEEPIHGELITSEYLRLGPDTRPSIVALRHQYEEIFKELVEQCMPEIRRDRTTVGVTTNILIGIASATHRWYRLDGPMDPGEMARFFVNVALNGAFAEKTHE